MGRGRGFCFTINNYVDGEIQALRHTFERMAGAYLILGKEVAPTTGTPHLQGYVHFPSQRTWSAVRSTFNRLIGAGRTHLELARGSPLDNIRYCEKGGDFSEMGERPTQGGRSDLDSVVRDVNDGEFYLNVSNSIE